MSSTPSFYINVDRVIMLIFSLWFMYFSPNSNFYLLSLFLTVGYYYAKLIKCIFGSLVSVIISCYHICKSFVICYQSVISEEPLES
ncbi:hypothetical protein L1987_36295 [Smallanthus sonchifolius]|uniref:Uncharacterized protein n=1 Tax=Smallanthus sonchifolius TaxID=185202 RepID=A0ACB9HEJ2_9ASTR|nr:hypothetical protein L1987_36295 [Smallanthus sonchifolius]